MFQKFSIFLNFHQNNPIGGFYARNRLRAFVKLENPSLTLILGGCKCIEAKIG
jgi:hypothetical protein